MRQTRRFARSCKKLQDYIVTEVDAAVAMIVQNPDGGEKKRATLPKSGSTRFTAWHSSICWDIRSRTTCASSISKLSDGTKTSAGI